MKTIVVMLAAGQGTRMKSKLPKVLHPIAGKPMIWHILEAVQPVASEKPVAVIGHGAERVSQFLEGKAQVVYQDPQLGTAHAVMQAESLVKGKADLVLVCYADMPLLRTETYKRIIEVQLKNKGPASILTVISDDPRGFGRIQRKQNRSVEAIIEETTASEEQLSIKELNVGCYCFNSDWLWDALKRIPRNAEKGEYYLTDIIGLAVAENLPVQSVTLEDNQEAIGINSRVHLAEVEAAMRSRINKTHMLNGVTLMDPATTYIDAGVVIGEDTTVMPDTFLQGEVRIGENCVIGPNTIIKDSIIDNECSILVSVLEGARVENKVHIGPFARLRRGARLMAGVHMGNFGEVKESTLGPGVKMGHFSYVGDAHIGAETNIGAGTITCNFDGERKHETTIGENVFIGSDTMLIAPLKVGDRARTGAGAVVNKDVPPDTLVVGMPARAIKKLNRQSGDKTRTTK